MADKVCLFNKCQAPPKWKLYGAATKKAVTYSKLLGQKRSFQEFIEFNDMQVSKSGKINSYCIVDKRYSKSKGSNIDIFISNQEEHHEALYLEYSVHKQNIIKNCNDIITFFNFNKNSTFHLRDSFVYVESANKFKWVLFFSLLEFLIKNLNMSIIGSQFYFPLFSKFLIMNELKLMLSLQNWFKNTNFIKTFSLTCKTSTFSFKKSLTSEKSHLLSRHQVPKYNMPFSPKQTIRKMKHLNTEAGKFTQKLKLKRKSIDSYTGDVCLPKTKRFSSKKNVCPCKNYTWKIFTPFQKVFLLNYTSILEAKKWMGGPEAMHVFPLDCGFQIDYMQNSNSSILHQNRKMLNQNNFSALNTSEKSSSVHLQEKVSEAKSVIGLALEKIKENQPKSKNTSDLLTLKEMNDRENFELSDFDDFQLSLECEKEKSKDEQVYSKVITTDKSLLKNISGPSSDNPLTHSLFGTDKCSVIFQTASGKSLKISETSLRAAKKIFADVSSESLDILPEKKTQNALQFKSFINDKNCMGFQTASGKSLHASKTAIEAAEKLFKINVEEKDVFPEIQVQTKQNNKECNSYLKDYVDDEMSKDLIENFFEDISFDEIEINTKPMDDSIALNVQKSEITKTHKIRKSLGGRRNLKPYSIKK